jgi:hypothetical protein
MNPRELRSLRAVLHKRSRFVERVYLGRDAVRRRSMGPNSAAVPAAATSSERRKS